MKRTFYSILALTAIAAALLLYLLLGTKSENTSSPEEWKPSPLIAEGSLLKTITIERPIGRIVFEYQEDPGIWLMTEPVKTFPDPLMHNALISDLTRLKREKLIELLPKDLSKYQLDKPVFGFRVTFRDGQPDLILHIGKLNYNQDHFFAKTDTEETVFLVTKDLYIYFDNDLDAFRSKALMFNHPENVISFEIKIEDPGLKAQLPDALEPKVVVQKQPGGEPLWVIVSPIKENAHFHQVRSFFLSLNQASAAAVIDVPDEKFEPYGLNPPRARVTFDLLAGGKEEILFGAPAKEEGTYYVRNAARPEVLVLGGDLYFRYLNAHFRDPLFLDSTHKLRISRLELELPDQPASSLTIVPEGKDLFHFADQPEEKILLRFLQPYFKPFRSPGIVIIHHGDPPPGNKYGLTPGALRIRIFEDEQLTLDATVGGTVSDPESGIFTYCQDNRRHLIALVPGDILSEMPRERKYLIARPEDLELYRHRMEKQKEKFHEPP